MKPKKLPPQPVRDLFEEPGSAAFVDLRGQRRLRGQGSNWTLNRQRLAEITRLIEHRHGGPVSTHDGSIYLTAALPALIEEAGGLAATGCVARIVSWAGIVVPLMAPAEIEECLAEARERNSEGHLHFRAQPIGDLLRLTIAERELLGIRMIRPAGMSAGQFAKYTRDRDAARKRAVRAAAGAKPQAQSEAREQPWIGLRISESTYRRRKRAGTLPTGDSISSGLETKSLQSRTERCHDAEQTLAGPAMGLGSASRGVGADGHAAGVRTKAARPRRTVVLPLPEEERQEVGPDLLDTWEPLGSVVARIVAPLAKYEGGAFTPAQRLAARDWLRHQGWSHGQFGSMIGVSRQQVTNAIRGRGRDNFGPAAAARLRALLPLAA